VALDANGDFVVVWEQPDADGRGVFGQRYASTGAPQGDAFRVNVITTSDQRFPSVAMSSSGDFVVVWESYGDSARTTTSSGAAFPAPALQ
jgi:hypothetical protein